MLKWIAGHLSHIEVVDKTVVQHGVRFGKADLISTTQHIASLK
jgi:hypothetical protein